MSVSEALERQCTLLVQQANSLREILLDSEDGSFAMERNSFAELAHNTAMCVKALQLEITKLEMEVTKLDRDVEELRGKPAR